MDYRHAHTKINVESVAATYQTLIPTMMEHPTASMDVSMTQTSSIQVSVDAAKMIHSIQIPIIHPTALMHAHTMLLKYIKEFVAAVLWMKTSMEMEFGTAWTAVSLQPIPMAMALQIVTINALHQH